MSGLTSLMPPEVPRHWQEDNDSTPGPPTSRCNRFQSANPVVSHLPIEIRCNLYWLCITEQRIAFVRPHYVGATDVYYWAISSARARTNRRTSRCILPTTLLTTFKTAVSVNGVTMLYRKYYEVTGYASFSVKNGIITNLQRANSP